jgi:hypothetical protein
MYAAFRHAKRDNGGSNCTNVRSILVHHRKDKKLQEYGRLYMCGWFRVGVGVGGQRVRDRNTAYIEDLTLRIRAS